MSVSLLWAGTDKLTVIKRFTGKLTQMFIIGGNNCRESTERSFFVEWSIFNNLGQHTTLHDNPANGKGATHPLTPMQAHTDSLAEAFIDWTTGQREDTKIVCV